MAIKASASWVNSGPKRADSEGRLQLGSFAVDKEFDLKFNELGQIVLTPVDQIPERELWLYRNSEAMALFEQGLLEAASGKVTEPQDYSQYTTDDIDDES